MKEAIGQIRFITHSENQFFSCEYSRDTEQ
ncbi:hypothetical protein J2X84_002585 [Pseudomonas corrugata]|jgi:hypothetical protein|nr:hypothetical protein [Pseudomonas corrugata]